MSDIARYAPVGARCLCGYWGDEYTVLAHVDRGGWRGLCVRVRWETGPSAGQVREHCTPFDPKRDRILSRPSGLFRVGSPMRSGWDAVPDTRDVRPDRPAFVLGRWDNVA